MTVVALPRTIDPERFRQVLGTLAGGVAVVTTVDAGGAPRGLTTTAFSSVSADPPLVLVCIGRDSRTLPALRHSRRFVVNLVHAGAEGLAVAFASKAEDKFAGTAWREAPSGPPVLHADALAWLECRTVREIEAGDHVVLIGHVEHGEAVEDDRRPLTYYRRRFGTWTDGGRFDERSFA